MYFFKNLFIENVEARSREHTEVKGYVKPIIADYQFVQLPEELRLIRRNLDFAIRNRLTELKKLGFIQTTDISKVTKCKENKLLYSAKENR